MVEATSSNRESLESVAVERAEQWFALLASIASEDFLARVLVGVGVGTFGGSLLMLAMTTRWRFTVRTLLFVMLYIAVIIGVPLGLVRRRLQNPRISVHPADFSVGLGQLRLHATARDEVDPWTSNGPVSRGGSTLIDRTSVLVALAAGIVPLGVVFYGYRRTGAGKAVAVRNAGNEPDRP